MKTLNNIQLDTYSDSDLVSTFYLLNTTPNEVTSLDFSKLTIFYGEKIYKVYEGYEFLSCETAGNRIKLRVGRALEPDTKTALSSLNQTVNALAIQGTEHTNGILDLEENLTDLYETMTEL